MYRGYWVRCKLRQVMQHAKYVSDEENSLEEDIDLNMNEEVCFGSIFQYHIYLATACTHSENSISCVIKSFF